MSKKSLALQRFEYGVYRLIAGAVRGASESKLRRWGTRLGNLSRRILRRRDRLALRNLSGAFPDRPAAEIRNILDECWRHFGREMLEFVQLQSKPIEEIAERCPFVNVELLEEGRRRGNGVMILSAHFGGWEIAGLALMAHVDNVKTVARRLDNEFLEEDLAKLRAQTGAEVVDRRRAARVLVRGLTENGVIVLLPDQAVLPREGILVPLLGRDAWTTDAPAKLALKHRSTIVFAFCIPDPTGHHLEFVEPIVVEELSEAERDPTALTRRINDVISRRIASRPELWLWMHDRWKGTGVSDAPNDK